MANFFTLPGDYVLNLLTREAPGLASLLGLARPEDAIVLTIVLSTFLWILVVVLFWGAVQLVQNLRRISGAIIRTIWYQLAQGVGNIRTRIICNLRQLFPKRRADDSVHSPETEFDDFDFTVLQAAADRGPGFTTSAPELASKYGLRPSQFQDSLRKLQSSKLIATVIGSTDGFDNYRLTDYGAAYIKMLDQATFRASAADR
jgi:hypothetical protein